MFRYQLSTLLLVMAAIAISCGILYGLQDDVLRGAFILVAALVYPTILIAILVYGPSKSRAFAMGALLPLGLLLVTLSIPIGMRLFEAFEFARQLPLDLKDLAVVIGARSASFVAACWIASLICGFLSFATSCLLLDK